MDPLSEVLSLLKPSTYGFRGLDAGGEWSLVYAAAPGIKCYAINSGSCCLCIDGESDARRLTAGDLVLLPGGPGFRLCSNPNAPAIDAVEFLTRAEAGSTMTLNGGGSCSGAGGYFEFEGLHVELLLVLLPSVIHVRDETNKEELRGLIERTMRELRDPKPGSNLLAEHLIQALLIEALRIHIAEHSPGRVGWLYALHDRQLSAAMTAIHAEPGDKWTLQSLAGIAAMSRSSFAEKFRLTVGETPMEYLTRWRMMVAADRLLREGTPIAALAAKLGYASESAFGAAFKRLVGVAPGQFVKAKRGVGSS